ncbi:MAG: adenylate/guanylate cyclase domain-containing protein [Gammaproteobacteria bacterium]|nr:adenylate/guanylate cyclase domain-containing protein [Gammaproteobacteria bacterium]
MTNSGSPQQYAILFADITGSTALYEKLGDAVAQAQIGIRLEKIASIVAAQGGRVIKTIGDEIMCCFDNPAAALHTSREIHDVMDRQTDASGLRLSVRIGAHYGPAILKDNDLFGDAVNVAARVAGLAKGQQTLTTGQTVDALEPADKGMIRLLSQAPVKGKAEALVLHEVIWRQENLTVLHSSRTQTSGGASERIVLKYQDRTIAVDGKGGTPFTLGRDDSCQLQIRSTLASRQHGKIEHRMGKFVYIDHSANGSYINLPEINNLFLHREEIPLFGSGILCCGEKIQDSNVHLIHFSCE